MIKKTFAYLMLLLLVGMAWEASYGDVVINEFCYNPSGSDTGKEWIEIYNSGPEAVELSGYDLDPSTAPYYTIPNGFILGAGAYVVVHINTIGVDTSTDLYDGGSNNMSNTAGPIALFSSTTHTTDNLVDYVEYGAGGQTNESKAVSKGIWTAGDFIPGVAEGHSLEYDGSGDTISDWFDQSVPTPGTDNSLPVVLSSFTATFTNSTVILKWTTESEEGNLGFNIYRSKSKNGPFKKINVPLIKGKGTTASRHEYEYTDDDVSVRDEYYYYIEDVDLKGETNKSKIIHVIWGVVSEVKLIFDEVAGDLTRTPDKFFLFQNYPNPFNPETWIPYQIPQESDVVLHIYNVFGKLLVTIDVGHKSPGRYLDRYSAIHWDGRNQNGDMVSSGIYFYQLRAGKFIATRKMLLVK